jgi:hypothetical protein
MTTMIAATSFPEPSTAASYRASCTPIIFGVTTGRVGLRWWMYVVAASFLALNSLNAYLVFRGPARATIG